MRCGCPEHTKREFMVKKITPLGVSLVARNSGAKITTTTWVFVEARLGQELPPYGRKVHYGYRLASARYRIASEDYEFASDTEQPCFSSLTVALEAMRRQTDPTWEPWSDGRPPHERDAKLFGNTRVAVVSRRAIFPQLMEMFSLPPEQQTHPVRILSCFAEVWGVLLPRREVPRVRDNKNVRLQFGV
jgi:hypothetical protein